MSGTDESEINMRKRKAHEKIEMEALMKKIKKAINNTPEWHWKLHKEDAGGAAPGCSKTPSVATAISTADSALPEATTITRIKTPSSATPIPAERHKPTIEDLIESENRRREFPTPRQRLQRVVLWLESIPSPAGWLPTDDDDNIDNYNCHSPVSFTTPQSGPSSDSTF